MDDTDRISSLPDEILCHILSFLPTVDFVSTSVLSKRWNPLWRSVPTFHFDFINFKVDELRVSSFFRSVNAFLHSRDLETPLKTFHLLYYPFRDDSSNIKTWLNYATTQGRVELLQLHFEELLYLLPSSVLACKTLVVLKLKHLILKDLSSVDLPDLKILRLELVDFSEGAGLAQLLSGCPNLEDLKTLNIFSGIPGKFTRLTKLVNANTKSGGVPLEVVNNVRFLSTRWIEKTDQIPEFPNLTHIELFSSTCTKDWNDVLKMLENSPRLQILVIIKEDHDLNDDEPEVCPYPESVPECISSYLRICCLTSFVSCQGDYQFARYILQNARHLQRMEITFRFYLSEDLRHREELSLIPRCSENCTLSFA